MAKSKHSKERPVESARPMDAASERLESSTLRQETTTPPRDAPPEGARLSAQPTNRQPAQQHQQAAQRHQQGRQKPRDNQSRR